MIPFAMLIQFFIVFASCIFNGIEVKEREFPCTVSLAFYYKNWIGKVRTQEYCAASLINSYTILTTAHCLYEYGNTIGVQIGVDKIAGHLDDGIVATLADFVVHPNYEAGAGPEFDVDPLESDIGLGFLDRNISESEYIRYCDVDPDPKIRKGTTGLFSGWGYLGDEFENKSGMLRKRPMVLQPMDYCNGTVHLTPVPYDNLTDSKNLCAGDGTHEACVGDSGGGLVRLGPDGKGSKRWSVFGIAAFPGFPSDFSFNGYLCGVGYTGFTRVGYYVDWIWNHTRKPGPPPASLSPLPYLEDIDFDLDKICYGKHLDVDVETICSGHGDCEYWDTCVCDRVGRTLYFGDECQHRRELSEEEVEELMFWEREKERKKKGEMEKLKRLEIQRYLDLVKISILVLVVLGLGILAVLLKIYRREGSL